MSIFVNREVKRLFIVLSCLFAAFVALSQACLWLATGAPNWILLLLTLLLATAVLTGCYVFFRRQKEIIEAATSQIRCFALGDSSARIDADNEGSLYKLFHEVNMLATTLAAHAKREQDIKVFLRNTISDISHQLKTPLAALTIYNSLMQEEYEDPAAVVAFVQKSEKELERIEMLVQNLLKITKLDAGSITMDRQAENVSDMMRELKSRFEVRAGQEHKCIVLSGPDDTSLSCDRNWLMEALSNILKNALDHTGPGCEVHIAWDRLPSGAQIEIRDNGSGIHPEDIYHIFKRFYRSRFSQDTQGIGLGLALSKAIVEAHDGSITVDSHLGSGSTFAVRFFEPYSDVS